MQRINSPITRIPSTAIAIASTITAAIATIAATTIARGVASTTTRSHLLGRLAAVLGKYDGDLTAVHFVPVKVIQSISSIAAVIKLNKGKSSGSLGVIVL